jgi:hypothetical protein
MAGISTVELMKPPLNNGMERSANTGDVIFHQRVCTHADAGREIASL